MSEYTIHPVIAGLFQTMPFTEIYPSLTPEEKVAVSQWMSPAPVALPVDDGFILPSTLAAKPEPVKVPRYFLPGPTIEDIMDLKPVTKHGIHTNGTVKKTNSPELIEDFVKRLSEVHSVHEIHLRFLPDGRVEARAGDAVEDHHSDFAVKLSRFDAGTYLIYLWDTQDRKWVYFDAAHMALENSQGGGPLTTLLDQVFIRDGNDLSRKEEGFLQKESLVTLTLNSAHAIQAQRRTLAIKLEVQKRLEADNFLAVVGTLVESIQGGTYFQDDSLEMQFVQTVEDVANRLFEPYLNTLANDSLSGFANSHLNRILRAYSAHYVWNILNIEKPIEKSIGFPYQMRIARLIQFVSEATIAPFKDHAALDRTIVIAQANANVEHLSGNAMDELCQLFHIYDHLVAP